MVGFGGPGTVKLGPRPLAKGESIVTPYNYSGSIAVGNVVVLDTTVANTIKTTTTLRDPNVLGFVKEIIGTVAYIAITGEIINAIANEAIAIGEAVCTAIIAGRVIGDSSIQAGRTIGIAKSVAAGAGSVFSLQLMRL